ncbi:sulfotransferase [Kordiimonas marina]|uniref:sulfotransferase n=1 Tax=Kordiimonas marina TaxID=2872312 RepID=UPI001FF68CFF|nr:sulfotransferase [Kordiimonas marina]MCJ9427600.1 sulfotransferase [Kordiimonas marina]
MNEASARPVFLFARQRSGTGALAGLLNKHAECQALGEVFGDAYAGSGTHYFGWLPGAVTERPALIQPGAAADRLSAYLDFLRAGARKPRLILDVKFSQTHHFEGYDKGLDATPALFRHVKVLGAPVIFLRRRNLLRAHLSKLSAEASGIWHKRMGEGASLPRLTVDPEAVLKNLRGRARLEARVDRFASMFPSRTELEYETLFTEEGGLTASAAEALEAALGVTGLGAIRTDQKKLRSGAIGDIVENADALEKALKDTKFTWMCEA